jgi:hypothetical protein
MDVRPAGAAHVQGEPVTVGDAPEVAGQHGFRDLGWYAPLHLACDASTRSAASSRSSIASQTA